jgi:hypothetical protein
MSGVKEGLYSSTRVSIAIGKQLAKGTPRTSNLIRGKEVEVKPGLPWKISDLGYEIGGFDVQSGIVKETVAPVVDINGHLRTGAFMMNLVAAANNAFISTGTATGTPLSTTVGTGGANRGQPIVPFTSVTGLTVGDLVQIGTPAGFPASSAPTEIHAVASIASLNVTLDGNLNYNWANGASITRVDSNKAVIHNPVHIAADQSSLGGDDYWTVFVQWQNAGVTQSILYYDGKVDTLSATLTSGATPTFQCVLQFINATIDTTITSTVTTVADNSGYVPRSAQGTFSVVNDTVNAPESITINLKTGLVEDYVLFSQTKDSNVPLAHELNFTTTGKFINAWWKALNFGSGVTLNSTVYTSTFSVLNQSPALIGTDTVPYAFGLFCNLVQLAQYDPDINSNAPIKSGIQMGRVISEIDDSQKHYWIFNNSSTSSVLSAA